MAIAEIFEDHEVFDIIDFRGEKHVILSKFEPGLYMTKPLKQWVSDNTYVKFDDTIGMGYALTLSNLGKHRGTITEYIDLVAEELAKVGHV